MSLASDEVIRAMLLLFANRPMWAFPILISMSCNCRRYAACRLVQRLVTRLAILHYIFGILVIAPSKLGHYRTLWTKSNSNTSILTAFNSEQKGRKHHGTRASGWWDMIHRSKMEISTCRFLHDTLTCRHVCHWELQSWLRLLWMYPSAAVWCIAKSTPSHFEFNQKHK